MNVKNVQRFNIPRPPILCRVLSLPSIARFPKLPPPFSSRTKAAVKSVLDENGANGARPAPLEAYQANAARVEDTDSARFPSPPPDDVTNDNTLDPTKPQERTIGTAVAPVYGSSETGGFGQRGYRESSREGNRPTTSNRRSAPSPIRVFATAPVSRGILTSAMVATTSSKGKKRGVNWGKLLCQGFRVHLRYQTFRDG